MLRLCYIFYNYRWRILFTMREGGPCFFVAGFPMYYNSVAIAANFFGPVPYFLYKRAGGFVVRWLNAFTSQGGFQLNGSTKCGYNNNIITVQFVPVHEHIALGIHNKPYT